MQVVLCIYIYKKKMLIYKHNEARIYILGREKKVGKKKCLNNTREKKKAKGKL
jgi:hypothetical protein